MKINRLLLARLVKIVGAVLVAGVIFVLATLYLSERAVSSSLRDRLSDVTTTNRRNRPTAEFVEAEFAHNDCRKGYELVFLARVGEVFAGDLTPEQRDAATAAVVAAGRDVDAARIEMLCPTPQPAEFDDDGNMIKPPVIPEIPKPGTR